MIAELGWTTPANRAPSGVSDRQSRLAQTFARYPDASECRFCGSPIRPHDGIPQMWVHWVHVSTELPRCVGTPAVESATPVEGQGALRLIEQAGEAA